MNSSFDTRGPTGIVIGFLGWVLNGVLVYSRAELDRDPRKKSKINVNMNWRSQLTARAKARLYISVRFQF